ncbi:restriction endonuclease subunit S [Collinsella ihumii]|uniref:restriction endonuclease subunit S n=1 Tax=Collinsella ihumii TaxID=1720204 RepID=UPI0025AB2A99|nr:restriction endonuclease subunit S [Collinsella ihumii]MDN0055599.1 restriction endonuclease subunit S [Collinsella ihumii]
MRALYHELFTYDKPEYGTIYDIADIVYGAAFNSTMFNEEEVGYPLIRIRDLSTFSPQFYTTEEHPKRTFIEPGYVIAGMDAEFVPTFWLGKKALLNQRVCRFAPPSDTAITESYLLFALKPLLAYIQNYASGTTVAHMGKSDLEALRVPLPKKRDLVKYAQLAEPMRKSIVCNSAECQRLAELRDALLPKLMSGEIDVSRIEVPMQPNNHLIVNRPNTTHYLATIALRRLEQQWQNITMISR